MKWAKTGLSKLFIIAFLIASVVSFLPNTAFATASSDAGDLTERWLLYRAMVGCYKGQDVGKQTIDDINAGGWLDRGFGGDQNVKTGYLNGSGESCGDGRFITSSLSKIGFQSNLESFCSMSTALRGGVSNYQNCMTGSSSEFDMSGSQDAQVTAFRSAVGTKVADSAKFPYAGTSAIKYWIGLKSLVKFCGGTDQGKLAAGQTGNVSGATDEVIVSEVLGDGTIENHVYKITKDQNDVISNLWTNIGNGSDPVYFEAMTCAQLAKLTRDNANGFSTFVKDYNRNHPDETPPGGTVSGSDPDTEGSTTSCSVDGVGWIICPVMTFLAKLNDAAFNFLSGFLIVPTIDKDGGTKWLEGTKIAWDAFRNFANIAFVIGFMVIIYSQITSAGVSNYGIKRLLPRLIVAAILVNVSYYLCVIAVDVSNIIGSSLVTLFNDISTSVVNKSSNILDAKEAAPGGWDTAVATLLQGGLILGILILVLLAPATLLVFGAVIFILMARQALIILLVAVSPLAFVAYLLPNTEQWFKKWWKIFSTLLMVFPVIALVFGASTLASVIIGTVATDDGQMLAIMALGIQALPLFAVPVLLKGSLSALGTIGAKLGGLQDKATGRMVRGVKEGRIGEAKAAFDRRSMQRSLNRRVGDGTLGRLNQRFDRSRLGRYVGGDRGAAVAAAQYDKTFQEDVSAAGVLQKDMGYDERKAIATTGKIGDKKVSESQRVAAINHIMENGNFNDRTEVLRSVGDMQKRELQATSDGYYKSGMQSVFGAALGGKIAEGGVRGVPADVASALSTEAIGNVEAGKLKAETLAGDADVARYVADQLIQGAASGTLTAQGIQNAKDASARVENTSGLQGQRTALIEEQLKKINGL